MSSTHIVDDNLQTAALLIAEAASNGAKLIVLPEMFVIMGMKASDAVGVQETYGDGEIQNFLAQQARSHGVVYCDVDLAYLRDKRKAIPIAEHARKLIVRTQA